MQFNRFEFENPWLLLLAVPALLMLFLRYRRHRGQAAIVFPSVARFKGVRPTLRQRLRILLPLLQTAAIVAFVLAIARPRQGDAYTVVRNQGIAIQMVLDRSGSMEETMQHDNRRPKRIDIVKDVFSQFVGGSDRLKGRTTDLIGLTTFARYTEENCPLVSEHEPLLTAVENLRTVAPALDEYSAPVRDIQKARSRGARLRENPLNATAIGDGLYRAALALISAEDDLAQETSLDTEISDQSSYRITGKVLIVLTDGENNAGRDPIEAGKFAAESDIRIYYVVFRDPYDEAEGFFGRRVVREYTEDELLAVPRQVVEPSGGRAFLARSGAELEEIYAEIDAIEKSDVGTIQFRSYHEKYRWFLIPGFVCALVAIFLGETFLRQIP